MLKTYIRDELAQLGRLGILSVADQEVAAATSLAASFVPNVSGRPAAAARAGVARGGRARRGVTGPATRPSRASQVHCGTSPPWARPSRPEVQRWLVMDTRAAGAHRRGALAEPWPCRSRPAPTRGSRPIRGIAFGATVASTPSTSVEGPRERGHRPSPAFRLLHTIGRRAVSHDDGRTDHPDVWRTAIVLQDVGPRWASMVHRVIGGRPSRSAHSSSAGGRSTSRAVRRPRRSPPDTSRVQAQIGPTSSSAAIDAGRLVVDQLAQLRPSGTRGGSPTLRSA